MDRAEALREEGFELHQAGRLTEAEQRYRQSLALDPSDTSTRHMLGTLRLQQGHAADALALLGEARSEVADDPELLAHHGLALHELKRFGEALAEFDLALGLDGEFALALFYRANSLRALARHPEALDGYERLAYLAPDFAGGWHGRGASLAELNRTDEALGAYDRAVSLDPSLALAWFNRGLLLQKLQRLAEALDSCAHAVRLLPNSSPAWTNLGGVQLAMKSWREALASLDRALVLDPANALAWSNRGTALKNLDDPKGALESVDRALRLQPDFANALCDRATLLCGRHDFAGGLEAADRAIAAEPGHADAWYNRGAALHGLKRYDEALAAYEKALALNPVHPSALGGAATMAIILCDFALSERYWPRIERRVGEGGLVPPFTLLGYPANEALRRRCAENYRHEKVIPDPAPPWAGRHQPRDRIRIAYLSADFHDHATAILMAGLFERHDRSRFEITALHFGDNDGSPIQARLKAAFEHFEDVREASDAEAARRIAERGIDLAIDLKGYTQGGRPGILALRPAPVQAQYLGFPGPMGVDFIDYLIADPVVAPFACQPDYAEKIVHLPHCYQVNDDTRVIAPVTPTRAEAGLPDGFVFCCFNASWKITAQVFDIWMRLLAAVPGSALWLLDDNPGATANLRSHAAARGIDPTRLVFARRAPNDRHLARHALADLFLDNLPCNAHTTASDALWAGLPLLTCRGETFAGRVAASLLTAVGLPELVTASLEDYEALALALAREPARLAAIRAKLAANRRTAPLFDTARFARDIEAVYTRMVEISRAGKPPQSFAVP